MLCWMISDFGAFGPDGLERRVSEAIKVGNAIKVVGTDLVNGIPVIAFQVNEKSSSRVGPDKLTFWIGNSDNVLYRLEVNLGTVTVTVTYSNLNSDIQIVLPNGE